MKRIINTNVVMAVLTVMAVIASSSAHAVETMSPARAADYAAIKSLIVKYAHVYDSRDIEGYVSIFTDDAEFTFNGGGMTGHDEIRAFITSVASSPVPEVKSYHSISNTLIEFVSDTEARHRSYWQIVSCAPGEPCTVGSMGVYEDTVVKQNGEWLIRKRDIPQ